MITIHPGESVITLEQRLELVKEAYENLPFNRLLGLTVTHLNEQEAGFSFAMQPDFVGNSRHDMLHGGVISAVLDTTGGITATGSVVTAMKKSSASQILDRIYHIGTIDMRVDYLRPGRGNSFVATGTVMRTGNRLSVVRMELKNELQLLIAAGTASYSVG